ncbi:MAG: flagellar hook-length control protein FliK [Oceanicoccus sp.]
MTVSSGYFIQQIIPHLVLQAESLHQQMTPSTMKANTDSLINQLVALKPLSGNQLASTAKAGIIDAIVTSNIRLAAPAGSSGGEQFRVSINTANQNFELTTNAPIATGSRLQITIAQNNLATILAIASPANRGVPGNTSSTGGGVNLTGLPLSTSSLPLQGNGPTTASAAHSNSLLNPSSKTRPIIEQGLRQALPQQQPIKTLLPLLLKIVQQPPTNWPKELTQNVAHLLKQFPSSQQLQQSPAVKQAIANSGIFLETKLAQLSTNASHNSKIAAGSSQPTSTSALGQDLKGLMQRIVPLLENTTRSLNVTQPTSTAAESPAFKLPLPGTQSLPLGTVEPAESLKPHASLLTSPLDPAVNNNASIVNSSSSNGKNVDVLLRQLSSQLLASLARTQLNQLETLATRQQNTPDNQGPVNSWTLEIPIIHGKNIDNLEMRIDQHLVDEEQGDSNDTGTKLWTVMLAFDLHKLGKMNVQLKVIDMSVSATVWSQLENTHREVQREIDGLKSNLEKVGVNVKQVDCQLGLPPKQNMPIYKQLVDIRT